ncbi:hypothetical protein WG902_04285 [Ramlibacter sp. PS3R-8]|uniref:hypothetical protein n=1 Tax=Ramlibacter sp. PS3R-8 TaxID=3133437 RepID=UPI0030997284
MGRAATSGRNAGHRWNGVSLLPAAVLALAGLAGPAFAAGETLQLPAETLIAEARTDQQPARLKVQASSLPRLDANDNGFQAPRVDVSLFPPGGPSGIGAVIGMSTPRVGVHSYGLNPPQPSVDLGVRWIQRLNSQHQIDVTAWRRMMMDQDAYSLIQRQQQQPLYAARVELNLAESSSKAGLMADLKSRFVGLQLESGGRISVKRKNGGAMVYYRTAF